MNYYEHHLGDYDGATAHLSWLEDCAYRRLICLYYRNESPIPGDLKQACRLVRAASKQERDAVEQVLQEFFVLADGAWHHKRCDADLDKYRSKSQKARESVSKRWEKRDAAAMPSHSKRNTNVSNSGYERNTNDIHRAPVPSPQTPDTRHQEKEISLLAQAPPRPSADGPQLALVEPPPAKPKGPPDCPHLAVLALWAQCLPSLPQHLPDQWRGARADHLRARWRETATAKGWTTANDGLAYFRKLFGYVGQSAFLTGRAPRHDATKRPFVIELEWLVNPTNWAKVHEGKYHQESA